MKLFQVKPLMLLWLVFAATNSLAAGSHGAPPPTGVCADANRPAQLMCAAAPSATFDAKGRLWVAWALGGHVYVNYSDDLGKTFSVPVAVNRKPEAISAHGENRPKIVPAKGGRVYVSWVTPLQKRFTGHVRFSYSEDGGEHFAEPIVVNDDRSVTSHRFEAMAVNDRGQVFLSWLDKRDRLKAENDGLAYRGAAVYYTRSDDGGKSFKSNNKIVDHSCECCRVAMAMDDQLPVILWRNIYGADVRDHALVRFVSDDQPGEVERVSYDEWHVDACPHHGPAISVADSGDYHLAWFNNASQKHGLFYARRAPDGRYTPAMNFGDYQAGAAHPSVLSIGNRVWLAWKQFDGQRESAWVQFSADGGEHWDAAKKMAQATVADYVFLLSSGERVFLQWHVVGEGLRLLPVEP